MLRRRSFLQAAVAASLIGLPVAEMAGAWSCVLPLLEPVLVAGIACVNFPGVSRTEVENTLWQRHRIRVRGGDPSRLRISTHIYTSYADLDRFVGNLNEFLKTRHAT